MRTVIDQVQQGKKRLCERKHWRHLSTTKEVLSTPVGAAAGAKTVTRPFERKGFRAPRIDSPEAERFLKRLQKLREIG